MAVSDDRGIGLLYGSLFAIKESANECLKYKIPKGVEDYLLNIIQICDDWMAWIDEAKKELEGVGHGLDAEEPHPSHRRW